MSTSAILGHLTPAEREQVREVRARFEKAWQNGDTPELARFLPPAGNRLRLPLLCELIEADLEACWKSGGQAYVQVYLSRFPEIRLNRDVLVALLAAEYCARRKFGDNPSLVDYKQRFPEVFEDLQRLVATPSSREDKGTHHTEMMGRPTARADATPHVVAVSAGVDLAMGGGYRLIERIGAGGFGEVWRAEAPGGVEVAVKVIFRPLDHADARGEYEALELIKRLRHPYLLQTHRFEPLEDRLVIVMELADGSLARRLRECTANGLPGIPPEELVRHYGEACEALDFLHGHAILHRDIKPDNMLLVAGHVKVCDFGLAKMLHSMRSIRVTGVSGTPAFMAPEAWRGRSERRSDQYSLAAAYVELRLNRPLFPGTDLFEIMTSHATQTPDLTPLPDIEQQVLQQALAKSPAQRFASCTEFYRALREAMNVESVNIRPRRNGSSATNQALPTRRAGGLSSTDETAPLEPETPPDGPQTPRQRFRGAVRVVAALAFLAVGAVALAPFLFPSPPPPSSPGGGSTVTGKKDETPQEQVYLPPGYQQAPSAQTITLGSRKVYNRLVHQQFEQVEFVFIPKSRPSDPEPFYILKNKVTNEVFEHFAENDEQLKDPKALWRLGASWGRKDLGYADHLRWPVYRATAYEAQRCAVWLKGKLPTARQWDKAAGRFDGFGSGGPFTVSAANGNQNPKGPDFALRPVGPQDVNALALDIVNISTPGNVYTWECSGMASNGQEWTRSELRGDDDESEELNFSIAAKAITKLSLRGASYDAPVPFQFGQLPYGEAPGTADPKISFRVVLELSPVMTE